MILQQFLLLLEEKDNFKRDIGSVTPCDMILLWTPLFPEGKGQTNHADACEKFVCPNISTFEPD